MTIAPKNPFILNLEYRDRLSAEERSVIEQGFSRHRRVAAKSDIVSEGARPTDSCLMLSGYSIRYHVLGDGRRQITAMHIPGDFVDLHSLLLDRMDHSVGALTDCVVALMPHEYLRRVTETHPHLARMLWLSTLIDAAVHRRWLVAAGRLSAVGRIAHFVCEMFVRLRVVHMCDGYTFRLPINQAELSDAMGLSVVHVNRTIQDLRKQGMIAWHGDEVKILDWDRLQEAAEFDPTYLNVVMEPR